MRKFRTIENKGIYKIEERRTKWKTIEFFDWFPAKFNLIHFADKTAVITFLKKELRTSFILDNQTYNL